MHVSKDAAPRGQKIVIRKFDKYVLISNYHLHMRFLKCLFLEDVDVSHMM
jgi:hypothetical protein